MRSSPLLALAGAAVLSLTSCTAHDPSAAAGPGAGSAAGPGAGPIENCGEKVLVESPPERVVSLDQGSTEILFALGLGDRMVGTAAWTDPVLPEFAGVNRSIPRLADNAPSWEAVLDVEPDFVTASFGSTLGEGGVAGRAQFHELGVGTYLSPADCVGTTGLTDRLDQRYPTLSGGERQRVQIARALAQEPDILVLDEPTNHLDIRHQLDLLTLVRATDTTVIAALHDLNLAATFCDRLVVLSDGRLVTGGAPREVLTADLIREVYGVEAEVTHDERGAHVRYLAR